MPATQFPWRAMAAISLALMAQGVAVTSCFPYVGFMVASFGVSDPDHAGYYAGYLTTAFMAGRVISSVFWGTLSDKIGRKPVLKLALTAICVGSLAFGMSWTLWAAIAVRFVTGSFNAVIAVARTAISEICGPEHELQGMGFLTGSWSVSFVVGPAIGGLLADLAKTYPDRFAADGIVARYPYLAPNAVAAALAAGALILVHFFLPETRWISDFAAVPQEDSNEEELQNIHNGGSCGTELSATKRKQGAEAAEDERGSGWPQPIPFKAKISGRCPADFAEEANGAAENGGATRRSRELSGELVRRNSKPLVAEGPSHQGPSSNNIAQNMEAGSSGSSSSCGCGAFSSIFKDAYCRLILGVYMVYSLLSIAFDEVYPLWCLSSPSIGGLGWSSSRIGQMLSVTGVFLVAFQFFLFSPLTKWLGVGRATYVCLGLMVPLYGIFPAAGLLYSPDSSGSLLWLAVVVLLVCIKCLGNVVFSSLAVLTNNAVTTEMRGRMNGIAMTVGSIAKGTGPPLGATIFAASLSDGLPAPFDYHLVFYLLAFMTLAVFLWVSRCIPDKMVRSGERGTAATVTLAARGPLAGDESQRGALLPPKNSPKNDSEVELV